MNELETKKREIVKYLLSQQVLVKPEHLVKLEQPEQIEQVHKAVLENMPAQQLVQELDNQDKFRTRIKVIWQYDDKPKKRSVSDFVNYFNMRYKTIEKILRQRQELANTTSIGRLQNKQDREAVTLIGIVSDKQITKNDNVVLTLEDPTGSIKVIVSKTRNEIIDLAKDIVLDEVIGITGTSGNRVVFANSIVLPDIPITGELKKSPTEQYIAVLSCIHVGSTLFRKEAFENFLNWLNSDDEISKKVCCIIIAGDVVDGIGIYPNQERELEVKDIYEQYKIIADFLSRVPAEIPIIITPGNHDAIRLSEPQPQLPKEFAQPLYDLPNTIMLGNPCTVNIGATKDFSGFDVLIYHGFSFDDYAEMVPSIKAGAENHSARAPLIMKFFLQRRHLAPTHTSTLYIPDAERDHLVIENIPDIFVAGHIHKSNSAYYRGINLVCASCFQDKTSFQEKVGHEPDPGIVPLVNLQTRKVVMKDFS